MAATAKLERQLNLMAALLETRRPLTADELRRRIPGYPERREAFRRAFERDKEELRAMGIPVVLEPIQGATPPTDGYRIHREQYALRDPGLEPDELAALHVAASAVRVEGVEGGAALWQLGGVPGDSGPGAEASSAGDVAPLPAPPGLVPLFDAVSERRGATFGYHGTSRSIDPYRLDFQRGRWYVTGFDHGRGEERSFRVDRIEGEVALGAPGAFDRPSSHVPGARLHPWQLGPGEPVLARVQVDADQAPMAVHYAGDDTRVETRPDGSVVLEMPVRNPAGFRSFVLGFLEHAEVLEPPSLRDELVQWLRTLAGGGPGRTTAGRRP